MEIQISFQDGPIEAEVVAAEDEEYTDVLDALAEFVEDYDGVGSRAQGPADNPTDGVKVNSETPTEKSDSDTGESNSFFDEVDATDAELQRVLKTGRVEDGDVEEFPEIIGNIDLLGTSDAEKLLNGSAIILTTLDEVHSTSRVKTTDLKEALENSDLNGDNWPNVHQQENKEVYLDSRGTGASGTTAIREPGKQDAYGYIQTLIDDLRGDIEDDE
jgi:hypothetical protein